MFNEEGGQRANAIPPQTFPASKLKRSLHMPKVTLMPSGIKAAMAGRNTTVRGRRAGCVGWTADAARRNDLFLRSVDPLALDGHSYALSLTVRDCPPSHEAWEALRRAFVERLRRMGMVRLHWLTEWQPRSRYGTGAVPHLHGIVTFHRCWCPIDRLYVINAEIPIKDAWLAVTKEYGTQRNGQVVKPVTHVKGWFRYLAKHCARGVKHYQRDAANLPASWQKTGRMWGKSGDWPVSSTEAELTEAAFFALRRFMRSYCLSQARTELANAKDGRKRSEAINRLCYLRQKLNKRSKKVSRVNAVSEWCPPEIVSRWMAETLELRTTINPETGEVLTVWDRRQE